MLGLGIDIRKDQGSGLSGSGSDALSPLLFNQTGVGEILIHNDEDISCQISTQDSYTTDKLRNGGSLSFNDQLQGTFSVTLQRCSGSDDTSVTVIAESGPVTMYPYAEYFQLNGVILSLLVTDGYTPTVSGYWDVVLGLTPGMDATSFGGQDISTTVQALYRIKWTYTVDGQTSDEFTSQLYPIDPLT